MFNLKKIQTIKSFGRRGTVAYRSLILLPKAERSTGMTQNQLAYLGLVETKRNNIAVANENERTHRANEGIALQNLVELNRSNQAKEGLTKQQNKETKRHNKATEKETRRANKAGVQQQKYATDVGSRTQVSVAGISNEAAKYSADRSYAGTIYSTDANTKVQAARRRVDKLIAKRGNLNAKEVARLKADNDYAMKLVDRSINNANISQRDKESLRSYKADLLRIESQLTLGELNAATSTLNTVLGNLGRLVPNVSSRTQSQPSIQSYYE